MIGNLFGRLILLLTVASVLSCGGVSNPDADNRGTGSGMPENTKKTDEELPSGRKTNSVESDPSGSVVSNKKDSAEKPRNVREFFMLMPDDMFTIEGCDREKDKYCRTAKAEYLKKYKTVEDLGNGYIEAGGDAAQSSFKMAIFKRPDGTYLVGLHVLGESENSFSFHDFSEGRWEDISIEVVPEYSSSNIYELPRYGTKVAVFAKRIVEQRRDYEISEKGEKLYDLKWENGEFSIER